MLPPRVAAMAGALLMLLPSPVLRTVPALGTAGVAHGSQAKPGQTQKPKKPAAAKLAEPWPDAATLAERRKDAEARRMFQDVEPLAFTLAADFKAVNRDRDYASTKTFPAVLTVNVGLPLRVMAPAQVGNAEGAWPQSRRGPVPPPTTVMVLV